MAGNADQMDFMHQLLTQNFLDMLKNGVEVYVDGEKTYRKCTAAELNTIRQFLKDNAVVSDSEFNGKLKELGDDLPFEDDKVVPFRDMKRGV